MAVHLRPARLTDVPEIVECYLRSWRAAYADDLDETTLDAEARKRRSYAWIAQRSHPEVRLRVVESHHRARRFYEREGWTVDEEMEPAANDFFRLVYYRRDLRR